MGDGGWWRGCVGEGWLLTMLCYVDCEKCVREFSHFRVFGEKNFCSRRWNVFGPFHHRSCPKSIWGATLWMQSPSSPPPPISSLNPRSYSASIWYLAELMRPRGRRRRLINLQIKIFISFEKQIVKFRCTILMYTVYCVYISHKNIPVTNEVNIFRRLIHCS